MAWVSMLFITYIVKAETALVTEFQTFKFQLFVQFTHKTTYAVAHFKQMGIGDYTINLLDGSVYYVSANLFIFMHCFDSY